ncbi:unnamed protein product, partial [marine sediment metagenome]
MDEIERAREAELQKLFEHDKELTDKSAAENTKRAYKNDTKIFVKFCDRFGFSPLPARPETVRLYVSHMDKENKTPATIRRALASIKLAHALAGFDSPMDANVKQKEKAVRRSRGTAQRQVKPITLLHLKQIIKCCSSDFIGTRDKALLLVGWSTALRRSELVALNVEDFDERPDGLVVFIRRSKTDQEGKGF